VIGVPPDDQLELPISLMPVHGSLPGPERSYTYCTNIDDPALRRTLLAALNADFVAPEAVRWGTYEPEFEETFWASPITRENMGEIHEQLADIIVRVSLPHVPARHHEAVRKKVRARFARIRPDIGGART
jgi:hypothetical protein